MGDFGADGARRRNAAVSVAGGNLGGRGALLLLAVGSIGFADAWSGVAKGFNVYLFLIGMMMLSELARQKGLFDWLASVATSHARGSPRRLFVLIYAVGIVTTVFLSNDATAVVLTPAV